MVSLLIVNPNSSQSVTQNLQKLIKPPSNVNLIYYTGPSNSPLEISGDETSKLSCQACLPDIVANELAAVDGVLVCCYSDHPLIYELRKHTRKPILGIFQASLLYALSQSPSNSVIVTSFNEWESILDSSIKDFFGGVFPPLLKPTKALDISVLNLSNDSEYEKIRIKVQQILSETSVKNILLGCAGMAGLDNKLSNDFPHVKFVDSVKIGVEFLSGLVNFDMGSGTN